MSRLTEMSEFSLQRHEEDKKEHPERHWLTKDSYEKLEAMNMCHYCAEHYEWNKQLVYDARTNTYYKNVKVVE